MKNLNKIFLVAVLFLIVSCKQERKGEKQNEIIKYDKSIKPLNLKDRSFKLYQPATEVKVDYEIAKAKMDNILKLVNRKELKFLPDVEKDAESKYIGFKNSADASGVFEMNKLDGRIILNTGTKEYQSDANTEALPNDQEAIKLSQKYYKQLGLVENERELSKPTISGLDMSVKKEGEKPKIFHKMITVRYNRVLDGLPVMGATRLVFTFGRNANLTSLIANWKKLKPSDRKVEIESDAKVVEKIIEQKLILETKGAKGISVTQRDVVLYDDGQGIIEPAIYVKSTVKYDGKGADGKLVSYTIPYDFYQPILKESRAKFPHVKDQALKILPKNEIRNIEKVKKDTSDE